MEKEKSSIELVGDLWRKRLEFLWKQCEFSEGKPLDLDWIDSEINREEGNK